MERSSLTLLVTFAAVYAATFVPAWQLLSRFLAVSAGQYEDLKHLGYFIK